MSERTISKPIAAAVSVALILGAMLTARVLVKTKPVAVKVPPEKRAELVELQILEATDETVILRHTGTVTPAKKVRLRARVGGEVVNMSPGFIDGGLLQQNESILTIDPVDYELALAQSRSALEKARFDYKIELGRQDVAKREWELLKPEGEVSELETELALRTPHLKASEAALLAAEASLKKAELDLERTQISSPFNAVVLSRNVNPGSQAAQQDVLAELVDTDAYWVIVSVPVDRIEWITIPGSKANIYSGNGHTLEGEVIKLLGALEEKGRMARVLIEVMDPLALLPENKGSKPLLLGEYVRTDIQGSVLEQVFSIPRSALRENSTVWLASPSNTLNISTCDILWRDADRVLIKDGLEAGDRLIITDLTTPIPGMDVTTGVESTPDEEAEESPEVPLPSESDVPHSET
jgi:RND family efflux transporter MFP subunit